MFKLSQSQSYSWPIEIQFPVDGGRHEKQNFDGVFKRVSQSRIKEIGKQIEASEISDMDLCKEVLVGWKGITDDNGDEVPFSESARDKLMDVPLVCAAIVNAFFGSLSAAKSKN